MSATPQQIAKLIALSQWMSEQKDLRPGFNINDAAWRFTPGYGVFDPPPPRPPWPQPKPGLSLEAFLTERNASNQEVGDSLRGLAEFLWTQLCPSAKTY